MEDVRKIIQAKLNEIEDVRCGIPIPDGLVAKGQTYFGYELQEIYHSSDFNKNYTMEISLTGRIVRRNLKEENTPSIVDHALDEIKEKLKELNFKYSYNDINLDDSFRKILFKANVKYNEINNEFVV